MLFYLRQVLLAIDQLISALTGGWADETLSARAWRLKDKHAFWLFAQGFIDGIFFWDPNHCEQSYIGEALRAQAPPELR